MPHGSLSGRTPSSRSDSDHGNVVVNLEAFGLGKTVCGQFQMFLQEKNKTKTKKILMKPENLH